MKTILQTQTTIALNIKINYNPKAIGNITTLIRLSLPLDNVAIKIR